MRGSTPPRAPHLRDIAENLNRVKGATLPCGVWGNAPKRKTQKKCNQPGFASMRR